jgi:hypothetical protein
VTALDASVRTLSVGAVLGLGYQGQAFQSALARAAKIVRETEEADPPISGAVEAHVNVVFQVPGAADGGWPVDFEGLRAGRLTRARRKLVVDVAVPEGLDRRGAELLIAAALVDSIPLARRHLAAKKVVGELQRAERVAMAAAEVLRAP